MSMLALYDRLMSAMVAALESTRVETVLVGYDELDHIKLHAKQIGDRTLLARATELQMRLERRLGELLHAAEQAGHLAKKGNNRRKAGDGALPPATLKEIGVDRKLSMKARKAALLPANDFETVVAGMHSRVASGKAIIVDPVSQAEKFAEQEQRRADHAARTMGGGRVEDLGELARSGFRAKTIGMDPQWKFLTRSPLGDGRSANIHYKTEEVDKIKNLPVGELADDDAILYMWMVDWCPQDALDLIAHYGFKHITTAFTWVKTNGRERDGAALDIWSESTWHFGQGYWTRANPEDCWLATKGKPKRLYANVRQLIVAPLMDHSRKPDEWLERAERLAAGPYLELQARRTRPGWISWGDELEWTGRPSEAGAPRTAQGESA
jgi:N6-adenosine-specific RNA methylase IME4